MDRTKKAKLKKAGWKVGTAQEFLGLSDEEALLIELKLALSESLRRRRESAGVTQAELAKRIGSSQSRVAKMEAADASVSMDLLMRAHIALGATPKELAKTIANAA